MPAFVQQVAASNIDSTATLTLTLPANATAGNKALVSVGYYNPSGLTTSVSGLGATWSRLFQQDVGGGTSVFFELWEGVGITGGTAAITVTASGSSFWDGNAAEFSGANYVGSATGGLVTGTSGTTVAKSLVSGDIVYGLIGWDSPTATATYTDSPAAWTTLTKGTDAASSSSLEPAYRVATGSESATRQAAFGSTRNIAMASVLLAATAPVSRRPRPPGAVTRQALVRASVR